MFFTATCECKLYENSTLVSIESLSNSELVSVIDAVYDVLESWNHASVQYDVFIYEYRTCFKLKRISIEIEGFLPSRNSVRGKQKLAAKRAIPLQYTNKKIRIYPKNTLCHKWKSIVEMELVIQ